MKRPSLDDWIAAMRASGHWISSCPSCGYFFAQQRHLRGRRADSCDWKRCILWTRWQRKYGRAPPEWLMAKWREAYGDAPISRAEHREYPRREAAA